MLKRCLCSWTENITTFKHVKVRTVRRYQKTQIEGQMTLRSNDSKGTNNDPQNITQKKQMMEKQKPTLKIDSAPVWLEMLLVRRSLQV